MVSDDGELGPVCPRKSACFELGQRPDEDAEPFGWEFVE